MNSLARRPQVLGRQNDLVLLRNNSGPEYLKGDHISKDEYEGIIKGYTDVRRNIYTESRAGHRKRGTQKRRLSTEKQQKGFYGVNIAENVQDIVERTDVLQERYS